ncbi:DNA/RNA-binding domain of Phe-tRNA-synthetase-like protein [Anoxybacillus tepidamans]|uniref:DNA/RNA-binding domain of Phe-tRNA-synthetase-like protein n=1 Tax=Anoxybacteroides tepidamans TaxID=265948 RepID=A0A7W8ITB1_9BACL|nr:phenylalanine--tRNA ligase beta subunit-related protein [Anoxybacillus tepidamans]MBB5326303.1 DNA/RNA-binding domain of Phe-tRNA-synthetase-like protein [Anoxybacillus tepidamans]
MEITVSEAVKQAIPLFKAGVIIYNDIVVDHSPQMLKGRLQLFQESIYFDLQETSISQIKELAEWRAIFKAIGTDPSRYRPSSESLYRRIQKQQFIPSIHSAADVNNFFSLYYKIPIGIYDAEQINGNILIDIGTDEDEYLAINGRTVQFARKLVTKDAIGPFGSPIVDSERTAITYKTKRAIQIAYLLPSMEQSECEQLVSSIQSMFTQIHGGEAFAQII